MNLIAGALGGGNDGAGRRSKDDPNLVVSARDRRRGGADDNEAQAGQLVTHALTSSHDASEDGTGRGAPIFPTLRGFGHGWQGQHNSDVARAGMVRRLTPVECERLQAFPDGWTIDSGPSLADAPNFPYRTDESCPKPDSPRYAATGDAVTANVAEWIGRRLEVVR